VPKNAELASNLRLARKWKRLSQQEAGDRLGVSRATIGNWESADGGTTPTREDVYRAAELYGVDPAKLYDEGKVVRLDLEGAGKQIAERLWQYSIRPSTRLRLAPRVYEVVHGYLARMADAGCSEEMIDEAERLMVDWNYSKIHKHDPRERSEEDQIVDIRAIWSAIEETLRDDGVKV
jgi:transcriptional regulator with XRE-family HTH domain